MDRGYVRSFMIYNTQSAHRFTWKWLARSEIGRPSVPWFGRGGQVNSMLGACGGGSVKEGGRPMNGSVVGGTGEKAFIGRVVKT